MQEGLYGTSLDMIQAIWRWRQTSTRAPVMTESSDNSIRHTAGGAAPALGVFRTAFEKTVHGVVVCGEDGTIVFANPQATLTFGFEPGELIGQPLTRLLPEMTRDRHQQLTADFWKDPQTGHLAAARTVEGTRKDGVAVPLEIGLNAFSESGVRFVVASILDVTERLNLEARLAAVTNERMGFQKLVADISARLGGVTAAELDDTIVDSLRQIGEALQLDRAMLWQRRAGEHQAVPTHVWSRDPSHRAEPFSIAEIPWTFSKLEAGEAFWFTSVDDLPDPIDRESIRQRGPRSGLSIPLRVARESEMDLSALSFATVSREQEWPAVIVERLRLVAGVMCQAFERVNSHNALVGALDEIKKLRERLSVENTELRREVRGLRPHSVIISESAAMKRALNSIEQVASTSATVLLLGETGSGKEVVAKAIHDLSPRHNRQMVRVSCAAIPTALIESELFGRERGAYTGALSRQIGRFEAANQSTLFLDEIGELPGEVQVKLLRVLQEKTIERLGSTQPIKVDVRIIAATNRNLEEAVENKSFREDLFYRLNVFPITVPPLRERIEDIPGLVWSFIDEFSKNFGKTIESISKESLQELQHYPWPGNVRELRNVIERAVILAGGKNLVVSPPRLSARVPQAAMTLTALEADHIRSVLESTNWRVRGRGGAAERLGLKPTTLESRMARLGIVRKKPV